MCNFTHVSHPLFTLTLTHRISPCRLPTSSPAAALPLTAATYIYCCHCCCCCSMGLPAVYQPGPEPLTSVQLLLSPISKLIHANSPITHTTHIHMWYQSTDTHHYSIDTSPNSWLIPYSSSQHTQTHTHALSAYPQLLSNHSGWYTYIHMITNVYTHTHTAVGNPPIPLFLIL